MEKKHKGHEDKGVISPQGAPVTEGNTLGIDEKRFNVPHSVPQGEGGVISPQAHKDMEHGGLGIADDLPKSKRRK